METNEPILSVRDLCFQYTKKRKILQNISFDILSISRLTASYTPG